MRKILVPILVGFLSSLTIDEAQAQTKANRQPATAKPQKTAPASAKPPPSNVKSRPSEQATTDVDKTAPANRPIMASLVLAPLSDFFFKYGVAGGYRPFNSSLEYVLQYLAGSEDLKASVGDTDSVTTTKADVSSWQFVGGARYYFGPSFNILGGLGYRSGEATLGMQHKIDTDIAIETAVKASGAVAALGIGNHWSWDNGVTFGADWLAVSIPLTKSPTYKVQGKGLSEQEMDEIEELSADLAEKIAGVSALSLCNLQVGFRF